MHSIYTEVIIEFNELANVLHISNLLYVILRTCKYGLLNRCTQFMLTPPIKAHGHVSAAKDTYIWHSSVLLEPRSRQF